MKKFLALILAGVMVASVSVMAFAASSKGEDIYKSIFKENYDKAYIDQLLDQLSESNTDAADALEEYLMGKFGENWSDDWEEDWQKFIYHPPYIPSDCSGSVDGESVDREEVIYDRGSEAEALAIKATGIPMETTLAAVEENKSVGEYMNNAVVAAPGLENAVPVSQGGNVIINGQPSNQTFSVLKVLSGHTDAAKSWAASMGGRVLNVARIDASVYFDTATVNFYMPGVRAGQNIQVYQYDYANGQWTSVAVAEIREDHVVVDMTSLGVLAFIEVPAAQ